MSLAKMDSAPSSSVVGLHGLNTSGLGIHHHLIANSEASLLRISNTSSNTGNTQKLTKNGTTIRDTKLQNNIYHSKFCF